MNAPSLTGCHRESVMTMISTWWWRHTRACGVRSAPCVCSPSKLWRASFGRDTLPLLLQSHGRNPPNSPSCIPNPQILPSQLCTGTNPQSNPYPLFPSRRISGMRVFLSYRRRDSHHTVSYYLIMARKTRSHFFSSYQVINNCKF